MAERKRSPGDVGAPSGARRRAILRERGLRLAARSAAAEARRPTIPVLLCAVGPNLFGLPLEEVRQVRRHERWGAAPTQHAALVGVVSEEGRILPAFDLATLLGAAQAQDDRGGWLAVLAPPIRAALRLSDLPAAADVERLDGEGDRACVRGGDHDGKLLVILSARELVAALQSTTHGAIAP